MGEIVLDWMSVDGPNEQWTSLGQSTYNDGKLRHECTTYTLSESKSNTQTHKE